jgi:Cdc6-like AAA superfamily ATPase
MTISESDFLIQREARVRRAFSPSAPVTSRDLFAGRLEQLVYVGGALREPGQHAVIYGERGVGKTSLATICAAVAAAEREDQRAVKVNCESSDDFGAIWRKVFRKIVVKSQLPTFGFGNGERKVITSASQYLIGVKNITPDNVCTGMKLLTQNGSLAVFLDEFDRVVDPLVHRLFADTLKTLSDEVTPATIILVGVADDVDELVKEHASVERAIVQVHMPRMSKSELADIVAHGLASVNMSADQSAVNQITALSQGLPHYTHLLAQNAAANAVSRKSNHVRPDDVEKAIETAIKRAQESIRDLYYRATYSTRNNMYKQVLLACACATTDEKGFFTAPAVRETLSIIMRKPYSTSQFARHLSALSEKERGPILRKEKRYQQIQYRFTDPLVQPYITMRGLRDALIDSYILKHVEDLL